MERSIPNSIHKAFVQNQRDECRFVGEDGQTAGAVSAMPGSHQQTYVLSITTKRIG